MQSEVQTEVLDQWIRCQSWLHISTRFNMFLKSSSKPNQIPPAIVITDEEHAPQEPSASSLTPPSASSLISTSASSMTSGKTLMNESNSRGRPSSRFPPISPLPRSPSDSGPRILPAARFSAPPRRSSSQSYSEGFSIVLKRQSVNFSQHRLTLDWLKLSLTDEPDLKKFLPSLPKRSSSLLYSEGISCR
jgi:hypothetical protein